MSLSRSEFLKIVARLTTFHFTTEVESKFAPFTVSVKPAPPTVALEGVTEVMETPGRSELMLRSQTLRPCVDARRVCVGLWSTSPSTATRGKPFTSELQLVPPLVV